MKISRKSELIELLRIFQNQINTIKSTIDRLVEKTIESEDETFELGNSETIQTSDSSQSIKLEDEGDISPTQVTEEISDQEEPTLTALPPKPESLKKEEIDSEKTLKPPPKLKTEAKTKKELKNEKEGLETKLSSVEDLLNFIDKKHSSGKLNDNEYAKRSKKLQSDLKKTKKRIAIINKLLEK